MAARIGRRFDFESLDPAGGGGPDLNQFQGASGTKSARFRVRATAARNG